MPNKLSVHYEKSLTTGLHLIEFLECSKSSLHQIKSPVLVFLALDFYLKLALEFTIGDSTLVLLKICPYFGHFFLGRIG